MDSRQKCSKRFFEKNRVSPILAKNCPKFVIRQPHGACNKHLERELQQIQLRTFILPYYVLIFPKTGFEERQVSFGTTEAKF